MNHIRIEPQEHPVLVTEPPLNPKLNRQKTIEIMLEGYNTPAVWIGNQAVLGLYSTGRFFGIVLDSGYGDSHIVPVYEGHAIQHAILTLNVGGQDITNYLIKLLSKKGYQFTTSAEKEIVRDIKRKVGYIAHDYVAEMKKVDIANNMERKYELPDGQIITINSERFKCTEVLFKPELIGKECKGAHKLINDSIMKCDTDIRRGLYKNTILCGGSTMFSGIDKRLTKEMKQLASNFNVKIIIAQDGIYSVWVGGSILGSLSTFNEIWISYDEYMETGPNIVNRKCF